jgi:molybdopterin-guanine dinucleotide biosynthesis protein A
VIVAGGAGSRLGGADKAALRHRGRSLLDRARAAVADADEVVVVGRDVGGGPLAALAAGVAGLREDYDLVVVLAVDMPHVTSQTVARLLAAADGCDGAWLTDPGGRRQLAAAIRPGVVPAPETVQGAPMRLLMDAGSTRDVPALGGEADDIDTWEDLARMGTPDRLGAVNLHDWIDELCDTLDIETEVDESLILDVAKVAADNVIRMAAPITTYLLGYAAGAAAADEEGVERLAALVQALAEGWDRPSGAPDPVDVADDVPDDAAVDHTDDEYDE